MSGTHFTAQAPIGGAITGWYLDSQGTMVHGFWVNFDATGVVHQFDVPNIGGPGVDQGTFPTAFANKTIAGHYVDDTYTWRGFVRKNGVFTVFQIPGQASFGTFVKGINGSGVVVGQYTYYVGNQGWTEMGGFIRSN